MNTKHSLFWAAMGLSSVCFEAAAQSAPPVDTNGRKFFRVWADWGEDRDGDLVPDWEEFAMMNGVAGVGQDGTLQAGGTLDQTANPTSGDANGNDVPDGEELDFDQDGIPSATDADPMDGVIAWTKARPTRYAMFDVPLRSYETGDPKWPVDVNSQGMVLFDDGIDWGGHLPCPCRSGRWSCHAGGRHQ
jgi:hypothetical protein